MALVKLFITGALFATGIYTQAESSRTKQQSSRLEAGWPGDAEGLKDHLNTWDKTELDTYERPSFHKGRTQSGETGGWIVEHKKKLTELGADVVWNSDKLQYELRTKEANSIQLFRQEWTSKVAKRLPADKVYLTKVVLDSRPISKKISCIEFKKKIESEIKNSKSESSSILYKSTESLDRKGECQIVTYDFMKGRIDGMVDLTKSSLEFAIWQFRPEY